MGIRARRLFVALVGGLSLVGCGAELSEERCRTTVWFAQGVDDGARGRPNASLEEYTQQCAEHHVSPDRNAWFWGHAKGLTTFCAETPGYDVGKNGVDYQNSCAGRPGEPAFLMGYLRGLSERLQSTGAQLTELRMSTGGTIAHADAEEITRRAFTLQTEYNRAQVQAVWAQERLGKLSGELR